MSSRDPKVNQGAKSFKDRIFGYFTPKNDASQPAERGINDALNPKSLSKSSSIKDDASPFPLAKAKVNDRVQIVALNCGDSNNRLMGMGLIPGAFVEIMSCTETGSIIVALHDHRLGLGAEMANQVQVIAIASSAETSKPNSHSTSGVKLQNAAIGSRLKLIGYEPTARDYKRKLLAIGLTPGTDFVVKRHAPLGDPTDIELRGFHLSLRKDEANALIVEPF